MQMLYNCWGISENQKHSTHEIAKHHKKTGGRNFVAHRFYEYLEIQVTMGMIRLTKNQTMLVYSDISHRPWVISTFLSMGWMSNYMNLFVCNDPAGEWLAQTHLRNGRGESTSHTRLVLDLLTGSKNNSCQFCIWSGYLLVKMLDQQAINDQEWKKCFWTLHLFYNSIRLWFKYFNHNLFRSLNMHITTQNRRVNSSNVFGYLKGSVEPGISKLKCRSPAFNVKQLSVMGWRVNKKLRPSTQLSQLWNTTKWCENHLVDNLLQAVSLCFYF